MSLVTPEHWKEVLGDMPMPEGATPEMMWAAIDAISEMNEIDETLQNIALYQGMRDDWIKRHDGSTEGEAVRLYNEIIDFYRGKLNG